MLKGKCGFITGGANGIGLACAKKFLENGAKVVIFDVAPEEEMQKTVDDLKKYGVVWGIRGDVTKFDEVERAVSFAVEKMGKLDIAVNSAGGGGGGNIYDTALEDFANCVSLCLFGVFNSMRHETAQMIKQGGPGAIVNISSINSTVPYYQYGAYCASKAAIESLSSCAAMEVGKYSIRINSICPGFTNTRLIGAFTSNEDVVKEVLDHTPLNRFGEAEDIANAALYLVSDLSAYVTGTKIVVDGGQQHTGYPSVWKYLFPPGVYEATYKNL